MEIVKVLIFIFYSMSFPLESGTKIETRSYWQLDEVQFIPKDSIYIRFNSRDIINFTKETEETIGILQRR